MFFRRILKPALAVLFIMGFSSCMKDVDFNQAGEISLRPEIQADLLIFDVDQNDFEVHQTSDTRTIIKDTVRLEFLDDRYIQKDLSKVEFSYKYTNSFTQAFSTTIYFLSQNNRIQHRVDFYIGAGSKDHPATTEKIDFIDQDQIQVIKQSIKMVVELEPLPNEEALEGNLAFASKGLFSFEF